ncbi:hypothetical protein J169_02820 [Xanthomonas citri pv. citri]|nr:hypothetical protein J151_02822 [Xanthomonas citri subsp. citri A306]AJY91617.1 hypothetical protein J169_02820 [Xanthomonas citri pv. citri]AJZ09357.1 hypothetical protein J172_02813 [Xanthomonas citri pv. citri]AJZ31525.1 hypothetical protein J171_02815 [Xanthomonas citri pv. citri]AJZ35988.1 hypothetical protein J170_02813 [Xanthomonas citri pv. citri]
MQRVRACLRQLLVLRLSVLLLPFLTLLRGAGRLAPRLHVEGMLVGRGGRRRVRICGSVRRARRSGQLLCGGGRLLPRLHIPQRLADVLAAGDRCNTLYAIGAALQMRNRAIGAKVSTRATLQLHRAIARKSLCLARALRRQFDCFTPLGCSSVPTMR